MREAMSISTTSSAPKLEASARDCLNVERPQRRICCASQPSASACSSAICCSSTSIPSSPTTCTQGANQRKHGRDRLRVVLRQVLFGQIENRLELLLGSNCL